MKNSLFAQALAKFTGGLLLVGALIFLPAGTPDYWQGWLLMGVLFIPMFGAGLVMLAKSPALLQKRLHVRNRITWQREKGRGAKRNWKSAMEDIWFATVSEDYCFHPECVRLRRRVLAPYREDVAPKDWEQTNEGRFRDTAPSNFWDDLTVPFWSMRENTDHPAQKPEKLIAKIILASSNPGDFVFDPFLGSGTTSVVAKKTGRHYLGIEAEEQYCLWAEQRLEMAAENPEIQGYVDGVFWERNTLAEQNGKK
jgi:site-specific DNA-methyltransferase (adenine-specific)